MHHMAAEKVVVHKAEQENRQNRQKQPGQPWKTMRLAAIEPTQSHYHRPQLKTDEAQKTDETDKARFIPDL